MGDEAGDYMLDQTLYLASRIYHSDESPIPLDVHSACAIGNYKCVQERIDEGVDLNGRNKAGWTPLMYASYVGHDTIVNLLLDSGVEPCRGTPTGLTPLMVAAGCGNESVCYFLIQAGAELDVQDVNGYSALVHGVRQGHQTVVQLLLEAEADMELTDKDNGYTALMFAAIEGDEIIADVLVACGADMGAKDKKGHNARYLAYDMHNVRMVTLLDNAMYMYRPMSETPTNEIIIEEPHNEGRDNSEGDSEERDLFSGAKEMEAYQQSQAIKKNIQYNLGRRSGPRWSLPHQYIAERHFSTSDSGLLGLKRMTLRPAMSMPERAHPPEIVTPDLPEQQEPDPKIVEFLDGLGLEKYVSILHEQEIDFEALINFSDEDLKRVGIKLMGPRRKLTLAISELKEQKQEEAVANAGGRKGQSEDDKGPSRKSSRSRPPLVKQSSTDVAEAYRQALDTISVLESKLAQEHHLRQTADSYLLNLQSSRQEAVNSVSAVRDSQEDISKHHKAVRATHAKLSKELDGLRTLSNASIEPTQLQHLYAEVVSLKSKMGMELEALSRSIDLMTELTAALSFHLKSNS